MKSAVKQIVAVLLAGTVFSGGYLYAQEKAFNEADIATLPPADRLAAAQGFLELHLQKFALDGSDNTSAQAASDRARDVMVVMDQATRDGKIARAVIDRLHWQYRTAHSRAASAPQVSQVASEASVKLAVLQALQNQRIIELLEQIAKIKPAGK